MPLTPMNRLSRRSVLAGFAAAGTSACVSISGRTPTWPPLVDLSAERLERITVCSRPFRPGGPRIEAETFAGKLLVHNYGHGGAGWSLSWGSSERAADLAVADGAPDRAAVIGAGALGLTTARALPMRGVAVTLYARELPEETRSMRATGSPVRSIASPRPSTSLHVPSAAARRAPAG